MAIDAALGEVVTSSTQPALGTIRLAWWREALERLDAAPPPPEPRLQEAAARLTTRGVTGAMLAGLEDGWATLLEEEPDMGRAGRRGEELFALLARLVDGEDPMLDIAGRLFAMGQLFRRNLPMTGAQAELEALAGYSFPRPLRPLTALARLAARDMRQLPRVEPEATPGRAAELLSHRLFGRVA